MDKDDRNGDEVNDRDEIDELREEVNKLRKMIEDTLFDIRTLINELENPFEYLSKYVGELPDIDNQVFSRIEGEGGGGDGGYEGRPRRDVGGKPDKKPKSDEGRERPERGSREAEVKKPVKREEHGEEIPRPMLDERKRSSLIYERALLVGDFLLRTFGKDAVHRMLHLFYRRGLITNEIYMTMLDIIENLNLDIDFSFIERKTTPEDYILALYLLNRVEDIDENEIFLILLMALKRTYQSPPDISSLLPKLFKEEGDKDDKRGVQ